MSGTKFIPFPKVKEAVPIDTVIRHLNLPLKRVKGNEYRCACPVHGGGPRGLAVTTDKLDDDDLPGVFKCHASGEKGGDSIGLVAHVRQSKPYAAMMELVEAHASWLLDEKQEAPLPVTIPEERKTKEEGADVSFRPLPYLIFDHPAVLALGITPEIARATGSGFAPRGFHRDGVALPIRTESGRLIGYISINDGIVKMPPQWKL